MRSSHRYLIMSRSVIIPSWQTNRNSGQSSTKSPTRKKTEPNDVQIRSIDVQTTPQSPQVLIPNTMSTFLTNLYDEALNFSDKDHMIFLGRVQGSKG